MVSGDRMMYLCLACAPVDNRVTEGQDRLVSSSVLFDASRTGIPVSGYLPVCCCDLLQMQMKEGGLCLPCVNALQDEVMGNFL